MTRSSVRLRVCVESAGTLLIALKLFVRLGFVADPLQTLTTIFENEKQNKNIYISKHLPKCFNFKLLYKKQLKLFTTQTLIPKSLITRSSVRLRVFVESAGTLQIALKLFVRLGFVADPLQTLTTIFENEKQNKR